MPDEDRQLWTAAWQARDDLYKTLFGEYTSVSPADYQLPDSLPTIPRPVIDEGGSGDPGVPDDTLTVIAYGPDPLRPYWTYITAGLSSPWYQEEPQEVSGFGCELMIKCPLEATWPAQILRSMALYIFNYTGTFSPGSLIALDSSIFPEADSQLKNIFVWYADEAPDCWYQLPAGGFGIFAAVGITDDELKFAESVENYGAWCIQEVLRRADIGQLTDPARQSVMKRPDIQAIIGSVKTFAQNFQEFGGCSPDLEVTDTS